MTGAVKKVLVIQAGSIAEFVLSLAAMKRIRLAHPHARITLLTVPQFEALARASPYFNHVDTGARPMAPGEWLALRGQILQAKYDRVYDLESSPTSRFLFRILWPFPPAWSGAVGGARLRHRNPALERMHTLERHAEQLQVAGVWPDAPTNSGDAPPPDLSWILRRAHEPRPVAGAAPPKPFVLLVPGGGEAKPEKRWPVANYAELARRLKARGFDIVIIGGPAESAMARAIQKVVGQARDLTGRTDFAQIAVLGARSVLAVGNNTGPLHLIAAAGAPTIALFDGADDTLVRAPRGHVAVIQAPTLAELSIETVANTAWSLLPRD
ncbi:MAG: glycosyltransferase family 9 protein [Caulobacter sp.]|nr:glycosyltransferase family 9 protein [Caulobacter sp.]